IPILRNPNEEELDHLQSNGTVVKIHLSVNPYLNNGLIYLARFKEKNLFNIVKSQIPFPSSPIQIFEKNQIRSIVPVDLKEMEYLEWIDYIHEDTSYISNESIKIEEAKGLPIELIEVVDLNNFYGKMAIL